MDDRFSYHFSLHLHFNDDVDVNALEKYFKMEAYKKTALKESKGKNKSAKIWFRTKELTEVYTDKAIEKFLTNVYDNFRDLKQILDENNGHGTFSSIFTKAKERPIISLTYKTIQILEQLGLSFDVDFV